MTDTNGADEPAQPEQAPPAQPEPKPAVQPGPPRPRVVTEVVAHLADLMQRAVQGEIVAIAIAAVGRGGVPIVGWAGQDDRTTNDLRAAVSDLDFAISEARAERSTPDLRAAPVVPQKEATDGPQHANAAGAPAVG